MRISIAREICHRHRNHSGFSLFSFAIDTKDTALLTQPAISAKAIAFVYANDLWTADLDGRNLAAADDRRRPGIEPGVLAGRHVSSPSAASTTATWTSISCRFQAAFPGG